MSAPPGQDVQAMFAEVAPRYDLLNRVLSGGTDRRWRRATVRALDLRPGDAVLDLCCGTGDLALACAAAGARVAGADFTAPMLRLAEEKRTRRRLDAHWLRADAQRLPFADDRFDAVTIGFGIRNVEDPRRALAECRRVLRPGGRLAVLEFFRIPNPAWRALFGGYFRHVLPRLAGLTRAGRGGAYRYLPRSVEDFAEPEEFAAWMRAAGFAGVTDRAFTGGVARLITGEA